MKIYKTYINRYIKVFTLFEIMLITATITSFLIPSLLGKYIDGFSGNNLTLSGGEIQKISICRALSKGAALLILDEPTSALDVKSKETLKNILLKEKKR